MPPPPPPPGPPIERTGRAPSLPKASLKPGYRDRLHSEIKQGRRLRHVETVDKSRPVVRADEGFEETSPPPGGQIEIAVQLFEAMGITREDKARRHDWVMRGFRQFDAPVSIVVCFDRALLKNTIAHFDTGAMTFGLVLAAWSKGLGAVINGQGIMQSPVVREVAEIPDDQVVLTCVALGWPDEDFIANSVVSRRRPADDVARFVGFDEG
ncbi:MAG: nitroreductase family protein [Pseudomonadota bacterium]